MCLIALALVGADGMGQAPGAEEGDVRQQPLNRLGAGMRNAGPVNLLDLCAHGSRRHRYLSQLPWFRCAPGRAH
jgi:hypothetical protein